MITKDWAMALGYRRVLYHVSFKNADGSPVRCRVNGKCKTWKRDPERWQLPVKHGLKTCFYLAPGNCHEWNLYESEDDMFRSLAAKVNLNPNAPLWMIREKLLEEGHHLHASLLDPYVLGQLTRSTP